MSNVELLNGTDYFNVDSDGVVSVKSNVKIDREEISEIVIKARLQVFISKNLLKIRIYV